MPQTARNVVEGALSIIGVLGRGRGLSPEDANDGFVSLNDMLAVWSNEGLVIPNITKTAGLTLTTSQTEYTVGTGLNLSMPEPIEIDYFELISGADRFQVERMGGFDEYIRNHTLGNNRPHRYFYERGRLFIYSPPDQGYSIELWSRNPIGPISNLSTAISFSDEYIPALKYNLAVMVAPENGKEPKQATAILAADYKTGIEMRRWKNEPVESEITMSNIRSGLRRR